MFRSCWRDKLHRMIHFLSLDQLRICYRSFLSRIPFIIFKLLSTKKWVDYFKKMNDKNVNKKDHWVLHRKSGRDFLLVKWRTEALDATKKMPKQADIISLNLYSLVTVKMTSEVKKVIFQWQVYSLSKLITVTRTRPLLTAWIDKLIFFQPKEKNTFL